MGTCHSAAETICKAGKLETLGRKGFNEIGHCVCQLSRLYIVFQGTLTEAFSVFTLYIPVIIILCMMQKNKIREKCHIRNRQLFFSLQPVCSCTQWPINLFLVLYKASTKTFVTHYQPGTGIHHQLFSWSRSKGNPHMLGISKIQVLLLLPGKETVAICNRGYVYIYVFGGL